MRTYKKGISLIVLVITVLVLAILATTVIISLSNTNIITEANEAVIKNKFKSMQEQLKFYVADQISVTKGDFKSTELDAAAKSDKIDEIFPELKDTKYYDYVSIVDGHIVMAEDMPDREVALEVISEYDDFEVITNYTQAEIDASNGKIVAIGATNALDVVGVYSADGTTLTITKNGATSDGKIKDNAFYSYDDGINLIPESVTKIKIKRGITEIGSSCFLNHNIQNVSLPYGLLTIGDYAFAFNGLSSLSLPDTLTTLGDHAFEGCINIKGTIVIPEGITSIGQYTFTGCGVTSVVLPSGLLTIGDYAFQYCSSLVNINIPENVTSIGGSAFNSSGITEITIPSNVTYIGIGAFYSCANLTSVTFENPNGWYTADSSTATSGTDISSTDLSNPSIAATYFTTTDMPKYWFRK